MTCRAVSTQDAHLFYYGLYNTSAKFWAVSLDIWKNFSNVRNAIKSLLLSSVRISNVFENLMDLRRRWEQVAPWSAMHLIMSLACDDSECFVPMVPFLSPCSRISTSIHNTNLPKLQITTSSVLCKNALRKLVFTNYLSHSMYIYISVSPLSLLSYPPLSLSPLSRDSPPYPLPSSLRLFIFSL